MFWPIVLLVISNVFMNLAWYGHLRFRESPLWLAILASWLIAFVEYCFQVPANRYGAERFSPLQLKIMQEALTLFVFSGFAMTCLGQKLGWNHLGAFGLILLAVFLVRQDDENRLPKTNEAGQLAAESTTSGGNDTNTGTEH